VPSRPVPFTPKQQEHVRALYTEGLAILAIAHELGVGPVRVARYVAEAIASRQLAERPILRRMRLTEVQRASARRTYEAGSYTVDEIALMHQVSRRYIERLMAAERLRRPEVGYRWKKHTDAECAEMVNRYVNRGQSLHSVALAMNTSREIVSHIVKAAGYRVLIGANSWEVNRKAGRVVQSTLGALPGTPRGRPRALPSLTPHR